jgi:hypothetical protein
MALSKLKAHLRRIGARPYDPSSKPSATSAASLIQKRAGPFSKLRDMKQIKSKPL